MAKTQAERAREYRQRKRDENVTDKRDVTECDASVTVVTKRETLPATCETCSRDWEGIGCTDKCRQAQQAITDLENHLTFADLPQHIQDAINRNCSDRLGYSKDAMTRRAIAHYEDVA